jgi:hypothetical protein
MKHVASVRDFFEGVAARGNEPQLSHLVGTWELDVEGAGTWKIAVNHGSLSVTEGPSSSDPASEPSTRIRIDEADLLRLIRGEGHANLVTELLRGGATVEGDVGFALKLHALLPLEEEPS